MFTFDDFLVGILSEYLLGCQLRLYNINTELLDRTLSFAQIAPYELAPVNGYTPKAAAFGVPVVTTTLNKQVFTVSGNSVEWPAVAGLLGASSFTHVGLIARVNTDRPRLVYLSAVNPQPTSLGSTVMFGAPFAVQAGNTFSYTPEVAISNDLFNL